MEHSGLATMLGAAWQAVMASPYLLAATGRNQTGEPRVLTTPLVRGTGIAKVGDSAC